MTLAWHFLKERGKLRDGTPAADPTGVEGFDGKLLVCIAGLHASISAMDALRFATGAIVRRVECVGDVLREPDKLVCTERRVLWTADATEALHGFSCWCAERALDSEEAAGLTVDPRSPHAVAVKRAWLRGKATNAELDAAWDAANAAARAAERAVQSAELERRLRALEP